MFRKNLVVNMKDINIRNPIIIDIDLKCWWWQTPKGFASWTNSALFIIRKNLKDREQPKTHGPFFLVSKGRGNLRGSFFVASIDRIYMIYWIFVFHHFPDESDVYKTINFNDFVKSQNCNGKVKSSKFKTREFCVIPLTRYPKDAYLAYAELTTK